jgi:hypothetical protein
MAERKELTLAELDQSLATWQTEVGNLGANIEELKSLLSYGIYYPMDGSARKMTGTTLELVPAAIAAARLVVRDFPLLHAAVEKAKAARQQIGRWSQRKGIDAVVDLLTDDVIEVSTQEVKLEDRDAFSSASKTIKTSAAKLKVEIAKNFRIANKTLHDVDEIWTETGEILVALRAEAETLKAQAQKAHPKGEMQEVTSLFNRLGQLDTQLYNDPLGCPKNVRAELNSYFSQVRNRITTLEREVAARQQAVKESVALAERNLAAVREARILALQLHVDCEAGIATPVGWKAPPSVKNLTEWLTSLKTALAEERWQAVTDGLRDWNREYEGVKADVAEVVRTNQGMVDKRKAILERWAACKRRTKELEVQGLVVDKALGKFAELAEASLTGKVKLDEAETAVYSYETALGERAARLEKK